MMNAKLIVAIIFGAVVLVAMARLVLWRRAAGDFGGTTTLRLAALLLLQPTCAILLFLTLFPPAGAQRSGILRIATAHTPGTAALASGPPIVILPEAPAIAGAAAMPDLATALRRYPGTARVSILGDGLTPRDLEAAQTVAVDFTPSSLRPGIRHLTMPQPTAPGAPFRLGGQLVGLSGATAELIDPAGRLTDRATPDAAGQFRLTGTARAAGTAMFMLRIRRNGQTVEEAAVPLIVRDAPAPRVLIVAAAPSAEVKFLRRWASDAGFTVVTQMQAGGGIQLGDAPVNLDAGTLRRFDIAIFDDRSWAAIGAKRGVVMGAVRDGLGLLLRPTGLLDSGKRGQWQMAGFTLSGPNSLSPLALPPATDPAISATRQGIGSEDAPTDIALPDDPLPDISRLSLVPMGTDSVPMLRDGAGTTIAAWHAAGQGRSAMFTVLDSYGLPLTGRRALYDDWWSQMLSAIARPAAAPSPVEGVAWAGERVALCGLSTPSRVTAPDGRAATVLPDRGCGAYWPMMAGWHSLSTSDGPRLFHVQAADALPIMRAARNMDAMLMLRAPVANRGMVSDVQERPGASWPFALGWLVVSAVLWWLERARLGRVTRADQSAT
ncbi:carboxypeptidase regulatory-like domain-containing protein [Sphingobium sp.]|uniref:carboxypeptidase regulatory-like domain-containing protein n=1 Tax=Sphingobium sp. TaxID=1912891 RepID=UPI003BB496F6